MTTISDASEDTSKSRTSPSSPFVSGGLGVLTSVKSACDGEWAMRREETDAFEYELALLVLLRRDEGLVLISQAARQSLIDTSSRLSFARPSNCRPPPLHRSSLTHILPPQRAAAALAADVAHRVHARGHVPVLGVAAGDVDDLVEEIGAARLAIELLRSARV